MPSCDRQKLLTRAALDRRLMENSHAEERQPSSDYLVFGRQVGYVIAANAVILILGLIQIPILTRSLGVALYGTWSLITVSVSLIVPIAVLSLNVAIVRFLAAEKDKARIRDEFTSTLSVVLLSGTIWSLLLFLLSGILAASILHDPDSSFYIKLGSFLVLLNSINLVAVSLFRARRMIGLYTILQVAQNALQVGLVVLFLKMGHQLTGVIVAVMVTLTLFNLLALLLAFRHIGLQIPRFTGIRSYLRWGIPLVPNLAILWVISVSDRYMVSYYLGIDSAGIYNAAYIIGQYATFALGPLGIVLYPSVMKSYGEGRLEDAKDYLKYSTKYLLMISIPAAVGISVLAKPLLSILTTPDFVSGGNVVPYVAIGSVMFCFYQIPIYVIHLTKKTEITIWLLVASAVSNILLNLLLIPRMGVEGAAVATLIAYGILGMLTVIVTRRYLKYDLSLPFILKSIVASIVMGTCVWLVKPESIGMVIASIAGGAVVYFVVLILLRALTKYEIRFFADFVKQNFRRG